MSDAEKQDSPRTASPLHIRLYRIGAFILVIGLISAAIIYFTTADKQYGAIGYETDGGNSYAIMPGDSKSYEYEVERIGGKSAVMGVEMNAWLASLWRGRRLAYTLASFSVVASLACFILAHLLSSASWPDNTEGRDD